MGFAAHVLLEHHNHAPKEIPMNIQAVDQALESFARLPSTVGVSLGLLASGERIIHHHGEVERHSSITPTDDTVYEIGSITKTFTGVLLAQAAATGLLGLHDDIREYLDGDYPNLEHDGQGIQAWHLISHLSGLPLMLPDVPGLFENPDPKALPYRLVELMGGYSREAFYRDLRSVQLDQVPGSQHRYSNAAAQLLGYILERVHGQPFDTLVQTGIAGLLGMQRTKVVLDESGVRLCAKGHADDGTIMPAIPNEFQAAGALKSSVTDMLEYVRFHLDQTSSIVRQSQAVMWSDANDYAVGLNWQINRMDGGRLRVFQSGGTFGFASYCAIYPELNAGIVLLANESDPKTQGRLEQVANAILLEMHAEGRP